MSELREDCVVVILRNTQYLPKGVKNNKNEKAPQLTCDIILHR